MDDLVNLLQNAMSDPATADRINGLLSSLGQSEQASEPPPESSDLPDVSKLMNISRILSSGSANDPSVALLTALRPLLKSDTQAKLDRVVKVFRLMAAYPVIKESGLLEMLE